MNSLRLLALIIFIGSCYPKIDIKGFDRAIWNEPFKSCTDTKVPLAKLILAQQEQLLGKGQAEIKALLGQPAEHELYRRNQKFFFYNLTPGDSCSSVTIPLRLSIRFDAIDRTKEVMIVEK